MTAVRPETARTRDRRRVADDLDLDPAARAEQAVAANQRRAAARAKVLTELLEGRPDLRGTYAPADFAAEAVRWCA